MTSSLCGVVVAEPALEGFEEENDLVWEQLCRGFQVLEKFSMYQKAAEEASPGVRERSGLGFLSQRGGLAPMAGLRGMVRQESCPLESSELEC